MTSSRALRNGVIGWFSIRTYVRVRATRGLRILLPLLILLVFAPPVHAFIVNIQVDTPVGLEVTARGQIPSSCDPSDTWTYNWGDMTTTDVSSNYADSQTHTYAAAGTYRIELRYRCGTRAFVVTWDNITVTKPEVTLALSASGLEVTTKASTNSACSASGTWKLNWGDGSTEVSISTGYTNNYRHKYETNGTKTVSMKWLCNSKATETTTTKDIEITAGNPNVALAVSAVGLTVSARATANATCDPSGDWSLDWGDDSTAVTISSGYGSARSYTYATEGSYTVELTWLCNDYETEHTASSEISVKPLPVVALTVRYVDEALSPGLVAALAAVPSWTMSQIVYNWGNGESSTVASNLGAEAQYSYAEGTCGRRTVTARATLQEDNRVVSGSQSLTFPACPKPPEDRSSGASNGGRSQGSARRADPARLPIPTQDHSRLPAGASVISDSSWIQFYEVSRAGIGVQSILDRGARSAIDVWGPMGVEAEVCFDGVGSLLLLDAAYSPRLEVPLESYLRAGKTCAQLDRAGTVVFMPGEPTHTIAPTATLEPSVPLAPMATATPARGPHMIADSLDTMVSLPDCEVSSLYILNLRESPAGPIMRWFNGVSPALARTANWFQVVDQGELGWISAHYVTTSGDCG